jgi:hypothetical protein
LLFLYPLRCPGKRYEVKSAERRGMLLLDGF